MTTRSTRPILYYKRGCTSCERARAWLSRHGIAVEEREIFKQPLSVSEIEDLLGPRPVTDVLSTRTRAYAEHGLTSATPSESELLRLMAQEPRLLRRPLLHAGQTLLVGFDQARWADVLAPQATPPARSAHVEVR